MILVRPRQTGHIPPPHHSPPFANAAVVASRSILPCSPNCSTNAVGAPLPCTFLGGSSGCLVAAWAETAGLKSATVPAGSPATARGAPVKREKRREKPERTTILIDHPERPVPEYGGVR